jgi:GTPase SAR1 family protein
MQLRNHSLLPTKIRPTDTKALDFSSSIPNIILFGETGVGKSSIINMLQGEEVATTSNGAYGCTSESSRHEVTLASRRSLVLSFSSDASDNISQQPLDIRSTGFGIHPVSTKATKAQSRHRKPCPTSSLSFGNYEQAETVLVA